MRILSQTTIYNLDRVHALQPLNLADSRVTAQKPLVLEFLTAHGLTLASPSVDKIRAIQDSVARFLIHPTPGFHTGGNASLNTDPLTIIGLTWAQVTAIANTTGRLAADATFWGGYQHNAYGILDKIFGTVNLSTGSRASDGTLSKIAAGRWQIRDINTYHFIQCTSQNAVLQMLLGAIGIQSMLLSTYGHDPACAYVPELGQWVYCDSTYNECFQTTSSSRYLSPLDLYSLSAAGRQSEIVPVKIAGPSWDAATYPPTGYFYAGHPDGMYLMVSHRCSANLTGDAQTNIPGTRVTPTGVRLVLDTPRLDESGSAPFNDPVIYRRESRAETLFSGFGAAFSQAKTFADGSTRVALINNWPSTVKYQRRANGGSWVDFTSSVETLSLGAGIVEYRPVDAQGWYGSSAVISV